MAALATAFAACGGGDDSDSSGEDPQKVVESASLKGVTSGELEMSLHVKADTDEGGEVDVELSGPFEAKTQKELPQLDLTAKVSGSAEGEDINFDGGLMLLTDRGFIEYEGTSYEIDPTTFGFAKSALEQAQQQNESENDIVACQQAAEGLEFSQFSDNLANEGSEDVGGTETTKVSGDLNVSGAIDALIELTEDPACKSQIEAAGDTLPIDELEEAKGELSKVIKKAHVDLYVGEDKIIRKMALELMVESPEDASEKVELELEIAVNGVNEEQSFSAPENAKPLEELFNKIGVDPQALLEAGSEGGLGSLLEDGGTSSGEGSSSGGGASEQEYVECLQGAQNAADLQKCASLLE
ncbi:MAG: hypothetical protein M3335_04665 [Actinomycetota bacterium]|nr:hypothetical protein [Actinomycetota bacterium]